MYVVFQNFSLKGEGSGFFWRVPLLEDFVDDIQNTCSMIVFYQMRYLSLTS